MFRLYLGELERGSELVRLGRPGDGDWRESIPKRVEPDHSLKSYLKVSGGVEKL